jgi:lipoprotein-anchoring transpeptidase ErfK/SrfK
VRGFRLLFAVLMVLGVTGVWIADHHGSANQVLMQTAAAAGQQGQQVVDPRDVPAVDDIAEGDPAEDTAAPADSTTSTAPAPTTTVPPLPLNSIPPNSGSGMRIIFSNSGNRVWLVDSNGQLVRSFLVSGKKGVPTPGTYHVMSQSRWTQSKFVSPVIHMEYMTRFAISPNKKNTIGFHAIPSREGVPMQTPAQLGTFQSGGCVRMLKDNAIFIFNWATVGTKVVVLA